jgi:hypothetical protein
MSFAPSQELGASGESAVDRVAKSRVNLNVKLLDKLFFENMENSYYLCRVKNLNNRCFYVYSRDRRTNF